MAAAPAYPAPVTDEKALSGVRPRYLFFCPWPVHPGTGVNNVIVGLSEVLSSQFQPEIVVTGWQRPPSGTTWLKLPALELTPRKLPGYLARLVPNAIRLVALGRGAIAINAHYFGSELLPLALLRKMRLLPKLVLSVHGADVSAAARGSRYERMLFAFICRQADAVIACSKSLGEQVRAISPEARIYPISNGVSPAPGTFGPRPLVDPYIVSVAAFVKKKGHDVLLQAFQILSPEFPDLKLVLVGNDGTERPSVEQEIKAAGLEDRVRIIVNLEHARIWNWVHHAHCFVHTAREEPFGIAVLEAALAGTPVVATAVGGVREYLCNEVDGLTCEPDNPEQFAARVRETLLDRARARGRAVRFQQKAGRFTWKAAWERYRAVSGL
jgi:glycosyltransferase involved in cell wall biosynthesis